eukprot:3709588-Rhodomonas_salina.1
MEDINPEGRSVWKQAQSIPGMRYASTGVVRRARHLGGGQSATLRKQKQENAISVQFFFPGVCAYAYLDSQGSTARARIWIIRC